MASSVWDLRDGVVANAKGTHDDEFYQLIATVFEVKGLVQVQGDILETSTGVRHGGLFRFEIRVGNIRGKVSFDPQTRTIRIIEGLEQLDQYFPRGIVCI